MTGIINFYHWVAQTSGMLMQTSPLAGIGFAVFMFVFCIVTPLLFLAALVKGFKINTSAQSRVERAAAYQQETRSGLQSLSGRIITFILALSLFAAAWVIMKDNEPGSQNIISVLVISGSLSFLTSLYPAQAATCLEFIEKYLPTRRRY